jgi:tRNA-dihydrouridine synthase A
MLQTAWGKVSIAPMMDITDRRFRHFIRLINPEVILYTEMVVAHAIVRGDRARLLAFDSSQHPVILQLGGDDPRLLAEAALIGEQYGYDGIDLNCGCPSDRVESGNFGVCLMRDAQQVAEIVGTLVNSVKIPISVKCRIGITGEESEPALHDFAEKIFAAGAAKLTVHARTATLGGLSPKENRQIPPLQYDIVYRLKAAMPEKFIEINGGIRSNAAIAEHLQKVDGVMLGRLAHEDPYFFAAGPQEDPDARLAILEKMAQYAERYEAPDMTAARFFRNMLNIFHAQPGARPARRFLSEEGRTMSPAAAVAQLRQRLAAGHSQQVSAGFLI